MNVENIVLSIAEQHGLKKRGNKFIGPCPECGGSRTSDKFNIRLDGGFKCYACDFRGDIITWLRKKEGLSCPDAHDRAGKECQAASTCPAAANCRYGDKTATPANASRRRSAQPYSHAAHGKSEPELATINPTNPNPQWRAYFEPLAEKAYKQLLDNSEQLAYLESRGIDMEAVVRFRLGWLDHQYHVPKSDIGMPVDDEKLKLWVPGDLLIPITKKGRLHRIRIRRTPESRERFLPDLKYSWIKGSGNLPLVIPAMSDKPRGAVIVEAELDAFAIASHHIDVVVVAVGSVAGGVDPLLRGYLQNLPVILVALDADDSSKNAVAAWKRAFDHARFWPTPETKDAGDYYRAGGDLNAWIEEGLPPVPAVDNSALTPSVSSAAGQAFSPGRKHHRGKGEESNTTSLPEHANGGASAIEVVLDTGETIYITQALNDEWRDLMAEGKPVFTRHEIAKLKAATAAMTAEEMGAAIAVAVETKMMFSGYISRGEALV